LSPLGVLKQYKPQPNQLYVKTVIGALSRWTGIFAKKHAFGKRGFSFENSIFDFISEPTLITNMSLLKEAISNIAL